CRRRTGCRAMRTGSSDRTGNTAAWRLRLYTLEEGSMRASFFVRIAIGILAALAAGIAAAQAPPVDFTKFTPWTPGADEGDYLLAPPYDDAPELTPRDNVPKGTVHRFTLSSTESKIYPGISKTAPGTVVP